jgi:predicted peptidase
MKRILSNLAVILMLVMVMSLSAVYVSPNDASSSETYVKNKHIKNATPITEVFADGQKVSAVVLEYDKDINNSKLTKSTFSVDGRTIIKVYANNAAAKATQGINGKYVIIELSPSDKGASTFVQEGRTSTRLEIRISVKQIGDIITAGGKKYSPDAQAIVNDKQINLVVDDFLKLEFQDPKTGKILRYNLFVPQQYDRNKSYPMVMFIHDAGVTSTETDRTLIQGLGAVIWATPSEQAKHECVVLAPQYDSVTVNDKSEYTDYLDITVNLINSIVNQYNIDKNRLYTTGQSMGCMLSIAINIKYPDLFAASLLVAGQWDANAMSVLAHKNMWIIVAEGDTRAFPGMNASLAVMEAAGAKISRAKWNARAGEAEAAANVRKMIEEGNNIKYVVYEKGTVWPEGQPQSGLPEHMETWKYAYSIEGVRDWLFTQKKSPRKDPLLFPKDDFTLETRTVKTSAGERKVTCRFYTHIPYVANPVDKDYESLNVSVPIKVDDVAVDAANAPILLTIGVGGYMSVKNAAGGAPGRGGMGGAPGGNSQVSGNADLALAAGYVVVSPGCRGRDNKAADGTYYGKAPAAIVDLKAAVRYVRHNAGVMPGNADWIVSAGVSAGGALSALLGASGNNQMYDVFLKEIGAADADDSIFASACFCPITDLDHADMAYEWMYGALPTRSGSLVDQELSRQLTALFADYQASLKLKGKNGFGTITADNYSKYLMRYYLIPSANDYLRGLTDEKRKEYLASNKWVTWVDNGATFAFADYVAHVGRMKGLPAFDDLAMTQPEPILFGSRTANARHFTDFSLRQTSGDKGAKIDSDLQTVVNMMNAMYFIGRDNGGCARYWWVRQGTSDNHTSQTVIANLATSLENRNKEVNTRLYWDAGHGANEDPEDFIAWIGAITGFSKHTNAWGPNGRSAGNFWIDPDHCDRTLRERPGAH